VGAVVKLNGDRRHGSDVSTRTASSARRQRCRRSRAGRTPALVCSRAP